MDFSIEKEQGNKIKIRVKFALQAGSEVKNQCTTEDARKLAENLGHEVERVVQGGLANNYNPRNLTAEFVFEVKQAVSDLETVAQGPFVDDGVKEAVDFTPPGYPFYDNAAVPEKPKRGRKKTSKKEEE